MGRMRKEKGMWNVCSFPVDDPEDVELVLLAHTSDLNYAFCQRDLLADRYQFEEPKREFVVITIQ
jgi:hypothetical protein